MEILATIMGACRALRELFLWLQLRCLLRASCAVYRCITFVCIYIYMYTPSLYAYTRTNSRILRAPL